MRIYSANVNTILSNTTSLISPYLLVKLNLPIPVYHTNAVSAITVSGLGTFSADNNLMSIDAPRLSSVVDRETYKITYSDYDFAFKDLFSAGITGTSVTIYIGFYNTFSTTFAGVAPGAPLNTLADLVVAYQGFVDSHGISANADNEMTAVLECSSPMADLDLTKTFYTSKDSMAQVNPSDTSFNQVYTGSRLIDLLWGKK